MKIQELRIGNLIMWEDESHDIISVTGLNIEDIDESVGTSNNEIAMIDEFIPIPLTEEWLIKFGFETKGKGWYKIRDFYTVRFTDIGVEIHFVHGTLKTVQSVHSLQNLYFALTGTELILKK